MELPIAFKSALADRYEIMSELAETPMAGLFLANDKRHRRHVTVKVLRPDAGMALSDVRFVREIKFLANLQHPSILSLYDSGRAANLLYYVMPFVPGETLRARLQRDGSLAVREALRIACQLGGAIDYAHRHGVIHRDIKPENILLGETHAILMDFGIARAVGLAGGERLTTPLSVGPGTPPYMSPEQFMPGHELDGRSDTYSLAVVVFEMLSGELPFSAEGSRTSIMRKINEPAPRLRSVRPEIPVGLDAAIARALATVPSERFGSAVEFVSALESAEKGEYLGTPAHGVPVSTAPGSPPAAHAAEFSGRTVGMIAGAVAVGGLLVWLLMR